MRNTEEEFKSPFDFWYSGQGERELARETYADESSIISGCKRNRPYTPMQPSDSYACVDGFGRQSFALPLSVRKRYLSDSVKIEE